MARTTWFLSDPHFDHANLVKGGRIANRPQFSTVDEMNGHIIGRINSLVRPNDILWLLGDLTLERVDFTRLARFVGSLNGEHHLLLGNHDYAPMQTYADMGFKSVGASYQTHKILFTHVPIHPGQFYRFIGNCHGHTHDKNVMLHGAGGSDLGIRDWRYLNVSCEVRDYTPISLDDVIANFKEAK